MKKAAKCFTVIGFSLLGTAWLQAQPFYHEDDHVLNYSGASRISLATGIPYIAISEYAYGISDRITVGVLGGLTPNVEGYGIRARGVIYQQFREFRVYFCVPILYYPKTKELGGDPWWLTRPNINFEWIAQTGFRYKVGGSLIVAASHVALFGDASKAKYSNGIWNAVHGGISFPLSTSLTFQCEASLVMDGVNVANSDWVGGPPVIAVLGISYVLH